jgi:DNA-binding transcriptional ArsR family regulator
MSDAPLWTALADPHRRAIVALLLERPRPVGEIVEACGLSQPSTSKHLKVLREAGLVTSERRGANNWYAVVPGALEALRGVLAPA